MGQLNRGRSRSGDASASQGRLLARPGQPLHAGPVGLQRLDLDGVRDGFIYVPAGYQPDHPAPLAVMLHGAGGIAQHGLDLFMPYADGAGLVLLAPDARGSTWDAVRVDDTAPLFMRCLWRDKRPAPVRGERRPRSDSPR